MKKYWKILLWILLLLLLLPKTLLAKEFGYVQLWVNGGIVEPDMPPFIHHNRTYVPLRFITESFGYSVKWVEGERKVLVKQGDKELNLKVDSPKALVNGKEIILDAPPMIYKDRTFVPLRFIAENFGLKVFWDEPIRLVAIGEYTPVMELPYFNTDYTGEYICRTKSTYFVNGKKKNYETRNKIYLEKIGFNSYKILRTDEEIHGKGGFTTLSYGKYYPMVGHFNITKAKTTNSYGIFQGFTHKEEEGYYYDEPQELVIGGKIYHKVK